MTTQTETRPVMTAAELATHQASAYGRDYSESDDGYGDMAAEEGRGWRAISGWGADGWDLGSWPYVVIYFHESGDTTIPGARYDLMQICEGDRTVYSFTSSADREAAADYLFLWYSADEDWSPVTWETRAQLDAGEIEIDPKFRGPYSVRRHAETD